MLQRTDRCNALSRRMVAQLQQAFEDIHQERGIRSTILIGTGDYFCSGSDLHEIAESFGHPEAFSQWDSDVRTFQELIEYMLRFPKPIIAALNGPVMGTGVALMLAADIVIASEKAFFCLPESCRGLTSGITTPLLAFRIGAGQAARLSLSADRVDAEAAKALNIFHEVVPDELIWVRAQELCEQIANGCIEAHQMTKRMINETIGEDLFTQLRVGAANTVSARTTDAAKEGIAAFIEKREPNWQQASTSDD